MGAANLVGYLAATVSAWTIIPALVFLTEVLRYPILASYVKHRWYILGIMIAGSKR